MTLAELTTPFRQHSIICYKADGIAVCCRRYQMQQVGGPLYKGQDTMNRCGEPEFSLFIVYEGLEHGLLYERHIQRPERYSVETCLDTLRQCGYDTLERYLEKMEQRIGNNQFVGNADIAFIRQFDPSLADRYAQHRLEYYARIEEEHRRQALEAEAEAKAERSRLEAARNAKRAKLHGWAGGMSALRFGQVMAALDKQIRVEGTVMRKHEFVLWALQNGWMPVEQEVLGVKSDKLRREYRLQKGHVFYLITKTEFDYAVYLTGHRTDGPAPAAGHTDMPVGE